MTRPEALKKDDPLLGSPGKGTDVWEMFCAAISGDLETIRRLLKEEPSLVRSNYAYRTPLYFAVRENQVEVAACLLERGADPNLPEEGIAPRGHALYSAVYNGHYEVAKFLLENAAIFLDHGANLHARDEELCSTPLGWAAKFGQKPMVEFLLSRVAKPNLPDDPPWAAPLAWATRRGHHEIAEALKRAENSAFSAPPGRK